MKPGDRGAATVLVAEDSPTQATQLRHLLRKHGFEVEVAQNGLLALEAMRRHRPDIVISDIVMPEMDGYDLCRAIRKDASLRDTCIVLLTSLSETEEVLHALECGADYFVTKPYDEDFLVARIRGILEPGDVDAPGKEHDGSEIVYRRKRYTIHTNRRRILDLLLLTYEAAIRKNTELQRVHDDLRSVNDRLEGALADRIRALQSETLERKRTEEALRDLKRAEETLVQRHKALSVLYQVTTVISSAQGLRDLCVGVLLSIAEIGLFRLLSNGTIFIVERGRFVDSYKVDARGCGVRSNLAECEECLCGIAAKTGEIVLSGDSGTDKRHTVKSAGESHGHVVVPLNTQARLVGVLCLCLEPGTLPEIDDATRELLRSLGNQVAVGIEHARLYEQTRHSSLHDPLTGLPNRRNMELFYEKAFAQALRGNPLSVLIFDIDHFKRFNDTFGHSAGDQVLISVGKTASEQLRDGDMIARYGGEEFLVICLGLGKTECRKVAERIRSSIQEKTDVTVSVGVAFYHADIPDGGTLIEQADNALYRAKHNGRNRVEVYARQEEETPISTPR